MSKTSLSLAEARTQLPADGKRLLRIWEQLGTSDYTRSELDRKILEATGIYPGDLARAQAIRSSLCLSGVVRERLDERGATVYTKAKTFPIHGDNRHGTDSFNAKLDKMAAEERRLVEVEEAASRERYENTAAYRERVEVEALIDRRVAELLAAERDKLTADVCRRSRRRGTNKLGDAS